MKIGQKIHINHLHGEDLTYDGKEGVITYIDDLGQLHGTWGGLAVIPEVDDYKVFDAIVCCICGAEYSGHGNDPYPVKEEGRCCDECNYKVVIPARMAKTNNKNAQ